MTNDWVAEARRLELEVHNFMDGQRQPGSARTMLEKFGPRDGRLLCRFRPGTTQDVDNAVASAKRSFEDGRWSKLSLQRRKDVLHRLADSIDRHAEELALLECLDVGKPITDALTFDVPQAAAKIRYCAEAADKIGACVYAVDHTSLSYQLRRPVGVVAAIVGWNFPILLAAGKIGPALAAGNSLILKPSELTSLSAARVAELAVEAGVPEGVFNVIHGDPSVGATLSCHPHVDLLSFTGSSVTGKQLLTASGRSNMKRMILECGGKAPNVVFDDAPDLNSVADAIVARAFRNQGQVCTASSRLLIQEGIRVDLLRAVIQKASKLTLGDPLDPVTKFGAVVSQKHKQKVLGYIDTGEKEGATLVYRSESRAPYPDGFYVPPAIFENVLPHHKIAREEIFGPVLSVLSFKDEEDAIRLANDTIYGLSAILWTKDLSRAHRVTHSIKAGWVVVNATCRPAGGPCAGVLPIGGHKESGIGTEGGLAGLEAYTSDTSVQFFV